MTNAESRETAKDGGTEAQAATKAAGPPGRPRVAKSRQRGGNGRRLSASGAVRSQARAKSAKTRATAAALKPRSESKGAQILELIRRAKHFPAEMNSPLVGVRGPSRADSTCRRFLHMAN
jgi:hypothetical protein